MFGNNSWLFGGDKGERVAAKLKQVNEQHQPYNADDTQLVCVGIDREGKEIWVAGWIASGDDSFNPETW